jgi:hypothetical protein
MSAVADVHWVFVHDIHGVGNGAVELGYQLHTM